MKQCNLFERQCISTEVLIEDTICKSPYWRRGRHFTCLPEPRKGLAVCRAKAPHHYRTDINYLVITKKGVALARITRNTKANWEPVDIESYCGDPRKYDHVL